MHVFSFARALVRPVTLLQALLAPDVFSAGLTEIRDVYRITGVFVKLDPTKKISNRDSEAQNDIFSDIWRESNTKCMSNINLYTLIFSARVCERETGQTFKVI